MDDNNGDAGMPTMGRERAAAVAKFGRFDAAFADALDAAIEHDGYGFWTREDLQPLTTSWKHAIARRYGEPWLADAVIAEGRATVDSFRQKSQFQPNLAAAADELEAEIEGLAP